MRNLVIGIILGACMFWLLIFTINTNIKIDKLAKAHDNLVNVLQQIYGKPQTPDKKPIAPAPLPVEQPKK